MLRTIFPYLSDMLCALHIDSECQHVRIHQKNERCPLIRNVLSYNLDSKPLPLFLKERRMEVKHGVLFITAITGYPEFLTLIKAKYSSPICLLKKKGSLGISVVSTREPEKKKGNKLWSLGGISTRTR